MPSEFKRIIETLINKVPNIDKAILSTHCHNDLGLAVANSLAGVMAGARQIECTVNGIGERAGNAALEEVVMAMRTRHDLMPYTTNINTKLLSKASKVVSNATGFPVQFNKAVVGKNCIIGANALITEKKEIPDNSLVMGSPGKIIRQIEEKEIMAIKENARRYINNWKNYKKNLK